MHVLYNMYIILDRQQKNVHGLNLNTQYIHFRKLPDQKEDVHIIDCSCDDKVLLFGKSYVL